MMYLQIAFVALMAALRISASQYKVPYTGVASTTQFYLGPELGAGTACGMSALPNGKHTSGKQGGGPGYLYAAINQLGFGASRGPGGACGVCYWITPVSDSGVALHENALKFVIIDECPANGGRSKNCGQCSPSDLSSGFYKLSLRSRNRPLTRSQPNEAFGAPWHFDIAIDAMSTAQYNQFFKGVTYGRDWKKTYFQEASCGPDNPTPPVKSWGCVENCPNQPGGPC